MKKISVTIFGDIYMLEEDDKLLHDLTKLINDYPANAFGILNKILNAKGLCITIDNLRS